jgi:hypothetical protein
MTTEDDKPRKPSRKPRPVKKKPPTMKSKPSKKDEPSDSFKKKIQEAIKVNLSEYAREKNLTHKQVSALNSYIEEHLSCFVLIGYNAAGDPVSIVNAKTPKDSDSLGTLLNKFLMKYIDPPQFPGQSGGPML